jgi:hypothetical protein
MPNEIGAVKFVEPLADMAVSDGLIYLGEGASQLGGGLWIAQATVAGGVQVP